MKELLQENGWLGVAFILTLQFVYTIWKDNNKSKDDALKENTAAIQKLQKDMNRFFTGLKLVAGNRWGPEIKPFLDEEKP
jgi:hypothetical protein